MEDSRFMLKIVVSLMTLDVSFIILEASFTLIYDVQGSLTMTVM
jgi:hypothetical protein